MPSLDITLKLEPRTLEPQVFKFIRGSYGPKSKFNFTIQNADGTVKDITGLTLNMVLFEKYRRIPLQDKLLTHVVSASGTAKYEPVRGDFDIMGYYYLRVSLADSSNKEWTEEVILAIE